MQKFIFGLFLISTASTFAQVTAITQDGRTVTLKNDGTYQYKGGSQLSSVVSSDCAQFSVGDFKITNRTNTTCKGSAYFKQWYSGKGKGGVQSNAKDFILKPGESITVIDVYAGNVEYTGWKEIPDPNNLGVFIFENAPSILKNGYVKTCEVSEFYLN